MYIQLERYIELVGCCLVVCGGFLLLVLGVYYWCILHFCDVE